MSFCITKEKKKNNAFVLPQFRLIILLLCPLNAMCVFCNQKRLKFILIVEIVDSAQEQVQCNQERSKRLNGLMGLE